MPKPLILSFDTSAAHCAVALLCGDDILANRTEELHKGQAERLFPMIEEILESAGKNWSDLAAIGVGIGPGNFTGTRLAVSSARGLSLSLGIPAVGVSSFEALAEGQEGPVTTCVDARRNQTYVQDITTDSPNPPELVENDRLAAYLSQPERAAFSAICVVSLQNCPVLPPKLPLAVAIATIAARKFTASAARPAPLYIRSADAAPSSEPAPVILP